MVLLPRIEKYISVIDSNMIFYGSPGVGKTTLARILANDFDTLHLIGKVGIDVLSEKMTNHIQSFNLMDAKKQKLIFIDECDKMSDALMTGLKSFIEQYPYVRFIFTTNHIDKISGELKSRFNCIPFDPVNTEEREFMYKKQVQYLRAVAKREEFEEFNNVELFNKLVNKNFPDLRSSVVALQHLIKTGDVTTSDYTSDKIDLYKFILSGDMDPVINYDFVMNNYFTNFDDAFKYLSRPLFEYLIDTNNELISDKGALILKKQKEYNETLDNTTDPIIHLINYIMDLKFAIKN